MSSPRVVVYTCVTGAYDKVLSPAVAPEGWDFICYTDGQCVVASPWQCREVPKQLGKMSNVKRQRVVKECPHRWLADYDVSIWLDANITVTGDLRDLLETIDFQKSHLWTHKHYCRDCIYKEAEACISIGKASREKVLPVVQRYREEGYPENNGLAETRVLARMHNEKDCIAFNEAWAVQTMLYCHRDQLSFNYVAWKQGFKYGEILGPDGKPTTCKSKDFSKMFSIRGHQV